MTDRRDPLDDSLDRVRQAMTRGRERATAHLDRAADRLDRRIERQTRKGELRTQRRLARRGRRGCGHPSQEVVDHRPLGEWEAQRSAGWVYLSAAAVFAFMVLALHAPWWFVFIALGLGVSGVRRLSLPSPRREAPLPLEPGPSELGREPLPAPPAAAPEPVAPPGPIAARLTRIDEVTDRLLREIEDGPDALRQVVRRPTETIDAMHAACHELARREEELRALLRPEDDERLSEERAAIATRLEQESDAVVRERFSGALAALDEQRAHRDELRTAADRLEAEQMRLIYVLENLHTQVVRVRSADTASADVAGAGLRRSLERLGDEIGAVAEALEWINHGDRPLGPGR